MTHSLFARLRADAIGLRPANKRRRYKVTPSLIGWVQTYNQPRYIMIELGAVITRQHSGYSTPVADVEHQRIGPGEIWVPCQYCFTDIFR